MPNLAISPGETLFFFLFFLAFIHMLRYRDPIRCSDCFHIEGCYFYMRSHKDRRKQRFASSEEKKSEVSFPLSIIYIGAKMFVRVALGFLTVSYYVFTAAWELRQIRFGWEQCDCRYSPKCAYGYGKANVSPPSGCEEWHLIGDMYHSPDGQKQVAGLLLGTSSARALATKKAPFTHKLLR